MPETDYVGAGSNLLQFTRFFNSGNGFGYSMLGEKWTHSYRYRAILNSTGSYVTLIRPDGSSVAFVYDSQTRKYTTNNRAGGTFTGVFSGSSFMQGTYVLSDGTKELYSYDGTLVSITYPSGGTVSTSYNNGDFTSASDDRGHTLSVTYARVNGFVRMNTVTLPDGGKLTYGYDTAGRLTSVTYPDNSIRKYTYPALQPGLVTPNADKLTGIIDEAGRPFATITYDGNGKVTSTQHGAGAELTSFAYLGSSTQVTHATGMVETIALASQYNRPKIQATSIACDTGCGSSGVLSEQYELSTAGDISGIINQNGIKTCFQYEATRSLPVKVLSGIAANMTCTDAFAAPPATAYLKTFTWHASFSQPLVVTEPLLKTTYTYDAAGRKLTQTEQATTDTSGFSGANATASGTARTTTWTYNSQGSLLTMKEPRTDVNATTTFAYDASQNLTSVTSAAGLVTTYGNYDANGRPQLITAPNGLQTTLTYDNRGRTTRIASAGMLTSYSYDPAGLLSTATLPSGVVLTFSYDDAQRLVATSDSLGNRVDRTLDAAGNVLQETIKGDGAVLALSRQAVYDQLSRAISVTRAQ